MVSQIFYGPVAELGVFRWYLIKTKLKLFQCARKIESAMAIFLQIVDVTECVNDLKNKTDDSDL